MAKRKKLAVDAPLSSEESVDSSKPMSAAPRSKKSQGKQRKRDKSTEEKEVESALIEDSEAGLRTKTNGSGKGKGPSQVKDKGKGKARELAIDSSDESQDEGEDGVDEDSLVEVTGSEGTLHGSDDEPGLGPWKPIDQKVWQEAADEEDDALFVDIIVRWRWHPKFHFAQYRVKWEGFADYHNTWEPIEQFGGDDVDAFWKDCEFAGVNTRPPRWDTSRDAVLKKLKREGKDIDNPEDTDSELSSLDPAIRRAARKRKRRTIRMDRVETREAYKRREKRDKAEAKAEMERQERAAEERRRKKREDEEAAKKKLASGSRGKITHGLKITTGGASKSVAPPSTPATASATKVSSNVPSTSKSTSNSASAATASRDGTTASTKAAPRNDPLEIARQFMTESDAKLKADRKKAKQQDEESSRARPTIAATSIDVSRPGTAGTSATGTVAAKEATREKESDATNPALRSGSMAATRGGAKPKGLYIGAHRNRVQTKTWDPLSIGPKPPSAAPTSTATPRSWNAMVGTSQAPPLVSPTNGWDEDPVASSDPVMSTAPIPPAHVVSTNGAAAQSSANSAMPATMSSLRARLPIRMGIDPRARPSMASNATANAFAGVPASPFGPTVATSPLHPAQSPMHPIHSPRDGPSSLMSPTLDQKGHELTPIERDRARQAMNQRWQMDHAMQLRIGSSYNLVCSHPDRERETRHLLSSVVRLIGGALIVSVEEKHKDPKRAVSAWVPSARVRLTPAEIEALKLPKVRFHAFTSAIEEIWPAEKGGLIMYTFGALMIKLVEQLFDKKEATVWPAGKGTCIVVHPWQKAVLQEMIDNDKVETFLREMLGMNDNVPDKGFSIVESGIALLDEMEEVPSELTASYLAASDVPEVSVLGLEKTTRLVDIEVSNTLHRLQYEWRFERRRFTLIMAKTRLAGREVPTDWAVL